MALSKIPMPLLIAAFVATTAVVIYLRLTVVSVPVVADPNFTGTLIKGSPYLWRGAASEINVVSNATIKLAHMPVFHVVYINGPLSNASLGAGRWLIYLSGGRPILVERVATPNGNTYQYLLKLVNVSKVNGLTVLVPQTFGASETLTAAEAQAISTHTGAVGWRVVNIYTNGTHIMLDVAPHNSNTGSTHYFRLPPAVATTSAKITSSGYGVSYKVGNITVSAYIMPYQHIVIVPNATASLHVMLLPTGAGLLGLLAIALLNRRAIHIGLITLFVSAAVAVAGPSVYAAFTPLMAGAIALYALRQEERVIERVVGLFLGLTIIWASDNRAIAQVLAGISYELVKPFFNALVDVLGIIGFGGVLGALLAWSLLSPRLMRIAEEEPLVSMGYVILGSVVLAGAIAAVPPFVALAMAIALLNQFSRALRGNIEALGEVAPALFLLAAIIQPTVLAPLGAVLAVIELAFGVLSRRHLAGAAMWATAAMLVSGL
jgi:hypothetical protein